MPALLTKRKQAWIERRRVDITRGAPLNPSVPVRLRYYAALADLIVRMTDETRKELEKFFKQPTAKEFFAEDASVSSQARILTNALTSKFNDLFSLKAKPLAEKLVRESDLASKQSLHRSLKDLSGGLALKTNIWTDELTQVMSASVTENVSLIKSISAQYLQGIQGATMRAITTGNGLADLVPFLQKHEGITLRRARIIAEDQSRKAFNQLNKHRMQAVGIKQFEWLHSSGSLEPRPLHIQYNGKVFDLANPPVIDNKTGERGIPGQLINCKCRMVPVITFDEVPDA